MADISMCADNDCPSRERCYRFIATPNPYMQAYGQFGRKEGAKQCDHFWRVKSTSQARSLDEALD